MGIHLTVRGPGPAAPFLSARDLFETERRLERPVTVRVVARPDERTRVEHTADDHELTVPRRVATSAMARSLALHEFAHMHRHERGSSPKFTGIFDMPISPLKTPHSRTKRGQVLSKSAVSLRVREKHNNYTILCTMHWLARR